MLSVIFFSGSSILTRKGRRQMSERLLMRSCLSQPCLRGTLSSFPGSGMGHRFPTPFPEETRTVLQIRVNPAFPGELIFEITSAKVWNFSAVFSFRRFLPGIGNPCPPGVVCGFNFN